MTAMRKLVLDAHGDKPSSNPNVRYELYDKAAFGNWNMRVVAPSYNDDRCFTDLDREMFKILESKLNDSSDPDDRYITMGDTMWAISEK